MDSISAQTTQADYANALTLGPSNFRSITAQVFNASVIAQLYELGEGGDVGTGGWTDEILLTPQTAQLSNCGGIRFKTNPDTPTLPGTVLAWASRSRDVMLSGSPLPPDSQVSGQASPDAETIVVNTTHGSGITYRQVIVGVPGTRIQTLGYRLQIFQGTNGEDGQFWWNNGNTLGLISYLARVNDAVNSGYELIEAQPGQWERTTVTGAGLYIGGQVSGGLDFAISGAITFRRIPA